MTAGKGLEAPHRRREQGPRIVEKLAVTAYGAAVWVVAHVPPRLARWVIGTGSQAGYRSFFYLQPETRTAAIGVVNTSGSGPADAGPDADAAWALRDIRDRLMQRVFPLFH